MNTKVVMFDVDGVLADFLRGFTALCAELSGGATPVYSHTDSAQWDLDPREFPAALVDEAWQAVTASSDFWLRLPPLATRDELRAVQALSLCHDLYFVTSRVGHRPRVQTEAWLERAGIATPAVLVTPLKAEMARALGAHYSIEDKAGNAVMVGYWSPETASYLIGRRYNAFDPAVIGSKVRRVETLGAFIQDVKAGR